MRSSLESLVVLTLLVGGTTMAAASGSEQTGQHVQVTLTSKGFEPASIPVKAGVPIVLVVTRTTDRTCAKEFVVADRRIKKALPLNRPVEIRLAPEKPGKVRFACGMGMVAGTIVVQ